MALLTTPQVSQPIRAGEVVQALRRVYFTAYNTTATAEATGVTWGASDVKISKNGGAGASTTNTPTQIDATNNPGEYYVDLTAAEILGGAAGLLKFRVTNAAISTLSVSAPVVKTDGTILSGTATAGAASTITFDSSATATARLYMGCDVAITGGTGIGQARKIYYYTAGRVATVWPQWDVTPDSTSTYEVIAASFPANVVRVGLAQTSGTGSSAIALDTGASSTDGVYFNLMITVVGGTGAGITGAQLVNSYTGSTRVAQCQTSFNATPDGTSIFVLFVETGELGGQVITTNTFATGAINAAAIATGAIAAAKFAAGAINAAAIASSALTSAKFDNTVNVQVIQTGTMQAGSTSTTAVLAAAANSATNDIYKGARLHIVSGTGVGQADRFVTGYVASTRTVTVDRAWAITPDNTTVYQVLPDSLEPTAAALAVWTTSAANAASVAGSVGEQVATASGAIGTAVTGTLGATTFTTSLTPATDAFKNQWLYWITGTLATQSQQVASNTSGGAITMVTAFTGAPANTDRFILVGK